MTAIGAITVAFRTELLVRARVLEEKAQTLFELLIEGKKNLQPTSNPLLIMNADWLLFI